MVVNNLIQAANGNMESQNNLQMSLVAQFDDICRYSSVLTIGCEEEFIGFVENEVNLMHKLKKTEEEIQILMERNNVLEIEKRKHDCQMRHTKILLELEVKKRRKIELEKTQLEKKIFLIQKILLNEKSTYDNEIMDAIFLLSNSSFKEKIEFQTNLVTIHDTVGSLLSLSDTDDTVADENNLDIDNFQEQMQVSEESSDELNNPIQKKKKSEGNLASTFNEVQSIFQMQLDEISNIKRSKSPNNNKSTVANEIFEIKCSDSLSYNESIVANEISEATGSIPHDSNGLNVFNETSEMKSSKTQSSSTSLAQLPDLIIESDSGFFKSCWHSFRIHSTGSNFTSTPKCKHNSLGRIQQIHSFVSKPVMRAEKCYFCCKTIVFCKQASKCTNCKMICHPECKEHCPLPCLPISLSQQNSIVTVADYTSLRIPSIMIRCINEIESRGLKDVGLYRMSGTEREVKDLKEKLLKGKNLNLNKVDVHVICGAMKEFLRSLKEPLISRSSWNICVNAANQDDEGISLKLLYDAICDMPDSNKETLAFLLLHLQRVADSTECKMPYENLAKVLGPTVVGYSTDNPSNSVILLETKLQCLVMQKLLKIPSDSWQKILNNRETEVPSISEIKSHDETPAVEIFGSEPINASIRKLKPAPRKLKINPKKGKHFFPSPLCHCDD
ncbi:rac GTPase-activating protein 1 [Nephila pilipes]|uniref:Rac GTPase-activating protein 1 n=1 Tax=Nephila pilipes TaxID=299642 RepID=A0A8X6QFL0_NEPPI|nr:rac GTPase-activating protein 1 [Nephila pilipes]